MPTDRKLEEFCLLGHNAVSPSENKPTLPRKAPPPPSGSKGEAKTQHEEGSKQIAA
jgi:hypothetical protein